jgi:hypothetical protein
VDVLLKEYDGKIYIFSANLRSKAERVRFHVASLPGEALVTAYREGRTLKAEQGYFEDTFGPLDVHIYIIEIPLRELKK